ncbi:MULTISPECIES: hypothetical protein [unclassified Pseudomonas]|uniref:hypothetical protein n=1 Tax=unclassified Pseudomonas TaxID=196821 RepID=UPI00224B6E05|nr:MULTISPECIES: hypothetical protein [unclassified Pseudomonas]MCX2817573.1 hypothetical protein [Pseudomonas sp. DCB_E]MCX9145338.1 hypothetical protein [Pseudomonas sp. DCB_Q]
MRTSTLNPDLFSKENFATSCIQKKKLLLGQEQNFDFDELAKEARASRCWLTTAAVGLAAIEIDHLNKHAYLLALDSFIQLDLYESFFRLVELIPENAVDKTNISRRMIRFLWKTKRFDLCLKQSGEFPNDPFHIRQGFEAALVIRNHRAAMKYARTLDKHVTSSFFQKLSHWESQELTMPFNTHESALECINDLIEKRQYNTLTHAYWLCFQRDLLDFEILSRAITATPTEHPFCDRVCFFRSIANELYPQTHFLEAAAEFHLHKGQLELASIVLDAAKISSFGILKKKEMVRRALAPQDRSFLHESKSMYLNASRQNSLAWKKRIDKNCYLPRSLESLEHSTYAIPSLSITPPKIKRRSTPKVAVCISGQLRNFDSNSMHIWRSLVKPLNADVFIHTWDTQVLATSELKFLTRTLGREISSKLPSDLLHAEQFQRVFPKTSKLLAKDIQNPVDILKLYKLDNVKHVITEPAEAFDKYANRLGLSMNGKTNQAKMFYKLYACDQLRQQEELANGFEYDVVIRTRPDLIIDIPAIHEALEYCCRKPNSIFTSYFHHDGYGDQFAMGSSIAMSTYSNIWPKLESTRSFVLHPGFTGKGAEFLLGDHLFTSGLDVEVIECAEKSLRTELAVNIIDIRPALELDMASCARDDVSNFLDAVTTHYEGPRP